MINAVTLSKHRENQNLLYGRSYRQFDVRHHNEQSLLHFPVISSEATPPVVQCLWWCWSILGSAVVVVVLIRLSVPSWGGAPHFPWAPHHVPTLAWRSCKMVRLDDGLLQPANVWLNMVQISKLLQNYNNKGVEHIKYFTRHLTCVSRQVRWK